MAVQAPDDPGRARGKGVSGLSIAATNCENDVRRSLAFLVPLFYSVPILSKALPPGGFVPLERVCAAAGVRCAASGSWNQRPVRIAKDEALHGQSVVIHKEPEDFGAVEIRVPAGLSDRDSARLALCAMAYGLMDLVARQSIRGQAWTAPAARAGRPAFVSGRAMSNAERQARFRARQGYVAT
jgi:hypothetical protein